MPDIGSHGGIVLMWPSLAWAASLFNAANIALIASLIVGVFATLLIVWMGNVKEQYADLEARALKERTASLTVQSDQLKNDNLRLSIRLAELTTSRTIDTKAVTEAAKAFPNTKFDISVFAPDPEAEALAIQIDEALVKAGWLPLPWRMGSLGITRPGKPAWGMNSGRGAGVLVDSADTNLQISAVLAALRLTIPDFAFQSSIGARIALSNHGALHFVIGKKPAPAEAAVTR